MKEATGELSTTVITVVAIAAISALFVTFLYPQLRANIILNQACSNGPSYSFDGDSYRIRCGEVITTGNDAGSWRCAVSNSANTTPNPAGASTAANRVQTCKSNART